MTAFKNLTSYSDAKCEWVSPTYPYDEENAQLKDENRTLRELVQSFHSAMLCTLDTGMWPTDPEWLERRMRELGVEA